MIKIVHVVKKKQKKLWRITKIFVILQTFSGMRGSKEFLILF